MAALPWNHWNVHFFYLITFFFTFQYILFFLSVFSFLPCHRCGLCVPDFSLQSAQLRATRGLWLVSSTFGNVHEGFGVSKVKGDLIHTFKVSLNREKKLLQVKSAKNKKRGGINGWTRLKFFCGFTHRLGGGDDKAFTCDVESNWALVLGAHFRPRFSFSAAFGWEKGDFGTCLKYEWINKRERNQMFV